MATSGSINFTETKHEIIVDALERIGAISSRESIPSNMYETASRTLNRMIKAWQVKYMKDWAIGFATVYLTNGQLKYELKSTSTDHASADTVETNLAAAASTSATSLTVDSTSGMAVSDYIGVVLDNNTIHWTTIATIPTSTTLTITTGLASAAANDNLVYTYTTPLETPLDIMYVVHRNESGTDRPIQLIDRIDYMDLAVKTTAGIPDKVYYQYGIDTGYMYVYLVPNNVTDRLVIAYRRSLQDMDNNADTLDFPPYWTEAVYLNLSTRLCGNLGMADKLTDDLRNEAAIALMDASSFDGEKTEIQLYPDQDC